MECPYCQQQHPGGGQFCTQTGKKFCPNCGQPAELSWRNCTRCGRDLSARTAAPKLPASGSKNTTRLFIVAGIFMLIMAAGIVAAFVGAATFMSISGQGPRQVQVSATVSQPAAVSGGEFPATAALPVNEAVGQGRIVFESDRDGNQEIYVMNADGSEQTRLTDNLAADSDPNWSPDGQKIAFCSKRDGNWEIYVMNADGTEQTRLTNNQANDAYPSWSPDGQAIAFSSNRDGNQQIYVMNSDGSKQTRLTNDKGNDSFPDWSGDGQKIVFQYAGSGSNDSADIYIINAFGGARTKIDTGGYGGFYPSFSPDGQKVVFLSNSDQRWGIAVTNLDDSKPIRLTSESNGFSGYGNFTENSFPAWSVDGQQIVFVSARDGNAEIYVMNADGNQPARLTNNQAFDGFPDWTPGIASAANAASVTAPVPAGPTPTAVSLVDSNLACALHAVGQPSEYAYMLEKPAHYALSCLDQTGWHVYEPDISTLLPQTPSWLSHLPASPWPAGLVPLTIPDIFAQCPGGRVYLVLSGKLYILENGALTDIQPDGYSEVEFLTCGKDNEVWMKLTNNQAEGYGVLRPGLGSGQSDPIDLPYVISHFDGSSWRHYPVKEYLGSGEFVDLIRSIAVAPYRSIWVATADSIVKFDGINVQVFEAGKGLVEDPGTHLLAIDANGMVWVVKSDGNNSILMKYDGTAWKHYPGPDEHINSLTFDKENKLWAVIGWYDHSIYSFDPKTNIWTLQFDKETFNGSILSLQFDRRGRLWALTAYGLSVYDGSKWITYQMHTADMYSNTANALIIFGNGPDLPALAVKPPGSIHGKLSNPDPKVFADKQIELCSEAVGFQYYGKTPCANQHYHTLVTVDSDGSFTFSDVPVGTYHLVIQVSTQNWMDVGAFKINAGAQTELGDIAYPPERK